MKKPSSHEQASLREKIIGLGEHSVRKHYYTSLQEHLDELERFRALLDQSKEMIFLGKDGVVIDINQAVASFFKLPREKLLRKPYEKLFPECVQKNIFSLLEGTKHTDTAILETEIKKIPVEFTLQVTLFQHETYVIIFATDISSRKKAEEEIHRLGNYDPLTHLPNRNMLNDRLYGLTQACAKEKLCGEHCKYSDTCKYSALLFIDIDNFKTLNDTEGHNYGDNLLKEIARRLNTQLSRGDFLSRFGGDEFVVLMESVHTELTQTIDIVESCVFREVYH
jgi:diguanylate cyclase (GGDEF)-like protein/PAS domain S-box-containing protein